MSGDMMRAASLPYIMAEHLQANLDEHDGWQAVQLHGGRWLVTEKEADR